MKFKKIYSTKYYANMCWGWGGVGGTFGNVEGSRTSEAIKNLSTSNNVPFSFKILMGNLLLKLCCKVYIYMYDHRIHALCLSSF